MCRAQIRRARVLIGAVLSSRGRSQGPSGSVRDDSSSRRAGGGRLGKNKSLTLPSCGTSAGLKLRHAISASLLAPIAGSARRAKRRGGGRGEEEAEECRGGCSGAGTLRLSACVIPCSPTRALFLSEASAALSQRFSPAASASYAEAACVGSAADVVASMTLSGRRRKGPCSSVSLRR